MKLEGGQGVVEGQHEGGALFRHLMLTKLHYCETVRSKERKKINLVS